MYIHFKGFLCSDTFQAESHMRVVGQRQRKGTVTIEVTGQKDSLCIRYTGQIEIIISTIGVNIEINTGG